MNKELDDIKEGSYTTLDLDTYGVRIKGTGPSDGELTIDNDNKVSAAKLCIDDYTISYNNAEYKVIKNNKCIIGNSKMNIKTTPNKDISVSVKIEIDYRDSPTKLYKIGENNDTWTEYSDGISLTSYTVLSKNWNNPDNTVTVYAKGVYENEEIIETYLIKNIDLDVPSAPIINSDYGYPILTEYGVQFRGDTTIKYDLRDDIENYYSLDNGVTWNKYYEKFEIQTALPILAKSIKKSGLEIITSKQITVPTDALGKLAYDGNNSTKEFIDKSARYLKIDNLLWNKKIILNVEETNQLNAYYIQFLDDNKNVINYQIVKSGDIQYTIPENTSWIRWQQISGKYGGLLISEIKNV